jgi:hypothetical protein
MNLESKVANNSRNRNSVFLFYYKIYLIPQNKDQHSYLINSEFKLSKSYLGNNHFMLFLTIIRISWLTTTMTTKNLVAIWFTVGKKKEYQG